MPDRLKYEPVKVGSLSSPGVAERLTPREIRLRQLAQEQARMPKSGPKPEPSKGMASLADVMAGVQRLKGR